MNTGDNDQVGYAVEPDTTRMSVDSASDPLFCPVQTIRHARLLVISKILILRCENSPAHDVIYAVLEK